MMTEKIISSPPNISLKIKVITAIFAFSLTSKSAIIISDFTASVVEIDNDSSSILNIGDSVNGSFYYSSNLIDSDSSSSLGSYVNNGNLALSGFSFSFGGLTYSASSSDNQIIGVSSPTNVSRSSFGYSLFFNGGGSSSLTGQVLQSDYFGSDDLPTSFNLVDFDSMWIEFSHDNHYVRATIDNIVSTPEPSSLGLLLLGSAGVMMRRRRQNN